MQTADCRRPRLEDLVAGVSSSNTYPFSQLFSSLYLITTAEYIFPLQSWEAWLCFNLW
ncbi:hypothetical protein LINPERPRIM_LOCUS29757 [Linum perenne]